MDLDVNFTTPNKISQNILDFCAEIDPTNRPVFVSVRPVKDVRFNYCLTDVPPYSRKWGGNTLFGWIISECRNVLLEAEFHACWLNPENELIDITPKSDNETQILFLPDCQRIYEHKAIANKYKALIDNESTRLWLKCANKKEEIRAKHFKNDEVDSVAASDEFLKWLSLLGPAKQKIGRNDPCPCGSGLKYKKCCLKSI